MYGDDSDDDDDINFQLRQRQYLSRKGLVGPRVELSFNEEDAWSHSDSDSDSRSRHIGDASRNGYSAVPVLNNSGYDSDESINGKPSDIVLTPTDNGRPALRVDVEKIVEKRTTFDSSVDTRPARDKPMKKPAKTPKKHHHHHHHHRRPLTDGGGGRDSDEQYGDMTAAEQLRGISEGIILLGDDDKDLENAMPRLQAALVALKFLIQEKPEVFQRLQSAKPFEAISEMMGDRLYHEEDSRSQNAGHDAQSPLAHIDNSRSAMSQFTKALTLREKMEKWRSGKTKGTYSPSSAALSMYGGNVSFELPILLSSVVDSRSEDIYTERCHSNWDAVVEMFQNTSFKCSISERDSYVQLMATIRRRVDMLHDEINEQVESDTKTSSLANILPFSPAGRKKKRDRRGSLTMSYVVEDTQLRGSMTRLALSGANNATKEDYDDLNSNGSGGGAQQQQVEAVSYTDSALKPALINMLMWLEAFNDRLKSLKEQQVDHSPLEKGFLHTLDNILCVLIYHGTGGDGVVVNSSSRSSRPQTSWTMRGELTSRRKQERAQFQTYVHELERRFFSASKKKRVWGFISILITFVGIGLFVVGAVWNINESQNMLEGVQLLSAEYGAFGTSVTRSVMKEASWVTHTAQAVVSLDPRHNVSFGVGTVSSNLMAFKSFFLYALPMFRVDSMYVCGNDGSFVGVFRTGTNRGTEDMDMSVIVERDTAGVWRQCPFSEPNSATKCVTWTPSFDPRTATWFTGGKVSQTWVTYMSSTTLLVPDSSSPAQPHLPQTSSRDGRKLGVTLATPVFGTGYIIQGVLGIDISYYRLSAKLQKEIELFRNSAILVMDSKMVPIGSTSLEPDSPMEELVKSRASESGFRVSDFANEQDAVVDSIRIAIFAADGGDAVHPNFGFRVVALAPRDDYLDIVRENMLRSFAIGATGLCFALMIAYCAFQIAHINDHRIKVKAKLKELAIKRIQQVTHGSAVLEDSSTDSDEDHVHGFEKSTAFLSEGNEASGGRSLTSFDTSMSFKKQKSQSVKKSLTSTSSGVNDIPLKAVGEAYRRYDDTHGGGGANDDHEEVLVSDDGTKHIHLNPTEHRMTHTHKGESGRQSAKLKLKMKHQQLALLHLHKEAVKFQFRVKLLCALSLSCLLAIWFQWSSTSNVFIADLTEHIHLRSQDRVFSAVDESVHDPVRALDVVVTVAKNDGFRTTNFGNETSDRFVAGVFRGFRQTSVSYVSVASAPIYRPVSLLGYMFISHFRGDFIGARLQTYNLTNSNTKAGMLNETILVGTSDKWTKDCYELRNVQNALTPLNMSQSHLSILGGEVVRVPTSDAVVYKDDGCTYNAHEREWYSKAVSDPRLYVSPLYSFFSPFGLPAESSQPAHSGIDADLTEPQRQRGITFSRALYNSTGGLVGVVGADLSLVMLNQVLKNFHFPSTNNASSFVMDRSGVLISTAESESTTERGALYEAEVSVHPLVSDSASFLSNTLEGGLAGIHNSPTGQATRVTRKLEAPVTSVYEVKAGSSSYMELDWLVVVSLSFDGFPQRFDDRHSRSFLISLGTFLACTFVIISTFKPFARRVLADHEHSKHHSKHARGKDRHRVINKDVIEKLGGEKIDPNVLRARMEMTRLLVNRACSSKWFYSIQIANRGAHTDVPVVLDDLKAHFRQTAIEHVQNAHEGRDILAQCALTVAYIDGVSNLFSSYRTDEPVVYDPENPDGANLKAMLRNTFTRKHEVYEEDTVFARFMRMVDPRQLYDLTTSLAYKVVFMLIVCVHILLVFMEPPTWEDMRKSGPNVLPLVIESIILLIELNDLLVDLSIKYYWQIENFELTRRDTRSVDIAYASVFFLVFLDFLSTIFWSFSWEYLMPLRPWMLVLRSGAIRNAAYSFLKTLYTARYVMLLYFFTVMIGAAMGVLMFRDILNTNGPQSSYVNYIRAVVTTFIYMSTGENFTEVVYPTLSVSPWFIVFWVSFLSMGIYFVFAMVVGIFQMGFQRRRYRMYMEDRLYKRTGMIAAFVLLDIDASMSLSEEEFVAFLQLLHKDMNQAKAQRIFERLNKTEEDDGEITLIEFVRGIEMMTWDRLSQQKKDYNISKFRILLQFAVFERTWFENARLICLVSNVWVAAMYGVYDKDRLLDVFMMGFLAIYCVEMTLRVYAYGLVEFWWYGIFHHTEKDMYQMYLNRYDIIIISLSAFGFFLSRAGKRELWFDEDGPLRFVLAMPLIRIFAAVPKTRELVFTLIKLLPQFAALLALLAVVFFTYGVIGVWILANKFSTVLDERDRPDGNFDDLGSALMVLFQMMVGESWHDVMYAAIRAERGFGVAWYFVSFVVIVTLLFTNVFMGLVLEGFTHLMTRKREEAIKERRKSQQADLLEHNRLHGDKNKRANSHYRGPSNVPSIGRRTPMRYQPTTPTGRHRLDHSDKEDGIDDGTARKYTSHYSNVGSVARSRSGIGNSMLQSLDQ